MDIKLWRELLYPYEIAVDELVLKINSIIKEYRTKGEYSPVEMVTGRVKKISSILDNFWKKSSPKDIYQEYLSERKNKLLIPFLFGVLFLVPPQTYLARVWRGEYNLNYFEHLKYY